MTWQLFLVLVCAFLGLAAVKLGCDWFERTTFAGESLQRWRFLRVLALVVVGGVAGWFLRGWDQPWLRDPFASGKWSVQSSGPNLLRSEASSGRVQVWSKERGAWVELGTAAN